MKKILVIGSMNTDMVVKCSRIPSPGETLLGGVFSKFFGGKGANQAIAARKIFPQTSFCAGVGADDSAEYLAYLKKQGLDISLVRKFKKANSGVALITVAADGENSIAVAPGANLMLSPADIGKIDFSKFSHVVMQLETPIATVAAALKAAKKAACITILTPAPAQILPLNILKDIDYLIPNEHEILLLQKEKFTDASAAAKSLLDRGVKNVLITLGKRGSKIINAGGEKIYSVYKVKTVDTVGAGDCFAGSFAAGLCIYNNDSDKAAKLASAAASLAVTKMGAQSYHSLAQVKKLMATKRVSKIS